MLNISTQYTPPLPCSHMSPIISQSLESQFTLGVAKTQGGAANLSVAA